jgi:hypothetical protein
VRNLLGGLPEASGNRVLIVIIVIEPSSKPGRMPAEVSTDTYYDEHDALYALAGSFGDSDGR